MTFVRVVIVFLCGVGATLGAYLSGIPQRVPEWWSSYSTPADDAAPATAVTVQTSTPGAVVGTVESTVPVGPPGYPAYPGATNGAAPAGAGYPPGPGLAPSGAPPIVAGGAPPYAASGAPYVGDGTPPLRVTLVPSRQGFEATCTIYAVVNRSQRHLVFNVDSPRLRPNHANGSKNGTGIFVKPGETVAYESMPEDCRDFRSLFAAHRGPVGGPVYGAPPPPGPLPSGDPTWAEPFVKIEIQDCAVGDCGPVQYPAQYPAQY